MKRRKLTTLDRLKIMVEQAICPKCGQKLGQLEGLEFDHVHALALGGTDTIDNIVAVHDDCHRVKTTGRHGESKLSISRDGDVPKITKLKRSAKCSTLGSGSSLSSQRPKTRWPKRKLQSRNTLRR